MKVLNLFGNPAGNGVKKEKIGAAVNIHYEIAAVEICIKESKMHLLEDE
ncbi:hypothetical protein L21SP3_02234 [Sedimentisphaera cyanobacteriorum]|uniref:Uncharacterized protein n=1 Tax=Sedimentisphaera cyanobacteriorum TaxID=1940790 RepID=A0A1Q2HSI1_9BACT|nr:hypothetical protein [Sedimentisphaera cyanobacteriorum]AQQ10402.1 hypothetical protein L21SP3_02234 [Sedimentisphaera cyanobacteriorum]